MAGPASRYMDFLRMLAASLRKPLAVVPFGLMRNDFVEKGHCDNLPVLVGTRVWGSYDPMKKEAIEGMMRSGILPHPQLPYLRLRSAGCLDNAEWRLELCGPQGRRIGAVVPKRAPGMRWMEREVPAPQVPFYLLATDRKAGPGGWFAFSEPVEIGRLFLAAESTRSFGKSVLVSGLTLTIVLAAYTFLRRPASRRCPTDPDTSKEGWKDRNEDIRYLYCRRPRTRGTAFGHHLCRSGTTSGSL